MDIDVRPFQAEFRILDVEDRADAPPRLEGYAALYDAPYTVGGFTEVISRGAFAEAAGRDDVRALLNHDANYVLGRTTSSTLSLADDETGLRISLSLPDYQWVRDQVVGPIKRGDVDQMSFGFQIATQDEEWSEDEDGSLLRKLLKVTRLFDVSVATFGANPETSVSVRTANRAATESARLNRALIDQRRRELDAASM